MMLDILQRGMTILDRVREMDIQSQTAMILFAVLLGFGIVNCVLGYRLLRFWMMLFGFVIGAGLGVFGAYQFGIEEKYLYLAAGACCGIFLAVIAFLSYRAGVFLMGAGLGLSLGIYVIHPTSSLTFFLCILAGVGLGALALRFEREVLIVGTSILGAVLAGFSAAKLLERDEIPYGILMSVGFAVIGMLIQFAINRPQYDEDEDEEAYRRENDRAARRRPSSRSRQTQEPGFDEQVYQQIYNSFDEDDIEEAYLKEKVLNEPETDPVEDFLTEKLDEVKEHRHKKHPAPSETATPDSPTPTRPRRRTTSTTESTGSSRRRSATSEETSTSSRRRTATPEENSTSSRRRTATPEETSTSSRRRTATLEESPESSRRRPTSSPQRQVDFPLTDDEEIAALHEKAWEQKKKSRRTPDR